MIVFSENTSPRLNYIIDTLFPATTIRTNNREEFLQYPGKKLNYSNEKISSNEIFVKPYSLLFEKNISPQQVEVFKWNGIPAFFKTGGDIPFDLLAASFYLVSRYEEYFSWEPDEYGRFPHISSIAFKNQFLEIPVIDQWITKIFPPKSEPQFSLIPTFDIDIAYKYLQKPFAKNFILGIKEFIFVKWRSLSYRMNVRNANQQDPFDVFDFIHTLAKKFSLQPIYFFLLAYKNGGYDKNISPQNKGMRDLISRVAQKNKTGIHPSWQSGENENILSEEIKILQQLSLQKVTTSRQHYIRMKLPNTYRALIANGIAEDYSMGYGSINGFRASTSKPSFWYDLEKEEKTNLKIYPFCYMDANSIFEEKLNPKETEAELEFYKKITTGTYGQMIGIWHNHFLTNEKEWLPWRNVFEKFIENSMLN